jgi:hypothetical protein
MSVGQARNDFNDRGLTRAQICTIYRMEAGGLRGNHHLSIFWICRRYWVKDRRRAGLGCGVTASFCLLMKQELFDMPQIPVRNRHYTHFSSFYKVTRYSYSAMHFEPANTSPD